MDSAKRISRNALSAFDVDHGRQITALSVIDATVSRAASVKLESQMMKASGAKSRTSRSPSTSSQKPSSSKGSTAKQPAKRRPSLRRSISPDSKQMLKDLKEIRANINRQNPNRAMSVHMGIELTTGPVPGLPNANFAAMRQVREIKTNDSIARTAIAESQIRVGSSVNQ